MLETLTGLRTGLLVSIAVVVLVLVANFESVRDALAVVTTIPAVLGGAMVMLLLTGSTLNIESFMGAIMAVGVAVGNAVLLVTFARARRMAGARPLRAIIEASDRRLRPILMTTLAMVVHAADGIRAGRRRRPARATGAGGDRRSVGLAIRNATGVAGGICRAYPRPTGAFQFP